MSEPRWLNDRERRVWLAFLVANRLLFAQFERDLQRESGLPLTYYEILSTLSDSPERALRMTQLSALLQVSPSRLSHAVNRLQEQGLVRRELCPSDRRGWIAVLTDQGYKVVVAAAPVHVDSVRTHLFDQLSPAQQEQLGAISETLLRHLAPGLSHEPSW